MMELEVPTSIRHGHENLISDIEYIMSFGGDIEKKATALHKLMQSHFKNEEQYAFPPLSLLLTLSEGRWKLEHKVAISMANKLQNELSQMKKEHENILKILEDFRIIAKEENNIFINRFIRDLFIHIDIEDQVLYPATLLVGNYLKKMDFS